MNPDFHDMLAALSAEDAEFLVVGAYALAAHGYPRATGYIDLWVRPTSDNASGVSWENGWDGHIVAVVEGLSLPVLGLDALIQNKRAAGRPKDLADLHTLTSR